MAKYNYPTINVSGRGSLKIYAIDHKSASLDSPGRATVTFIDENNQLNPPSLSVTTPTFLQIGGISFKGFPVSSEVSRSSDGESLLKVEYIDESFILDKYHVGLFGKHCNSPAPISTLFDGAKFKNNGMTFGSMKTFNRFSGSISEADTSSAPNWMIFVGKSIDPCLKNFADGGIDPCDPCPEPVNTQAQNAAKIDCDKKRSQEVFNVDYSFDELRNAIRLKNIKITVNTSFNNSYRASFSGSLRDVIKSWCSIFGFSFFFEDNTIKIYDLSTGVTINASFPDSVILNKTEKQSIEHTRAVSSIIHYQQDGVDRNYNCSDKHGKKILCRPLTVKDLGIKSVRENYGASSDYALYNLVELMSAFSSYDAVLREMVAWFDVYKIRDAGDAKSLIRQTYTSSSPFRGVKYGGYHRLKLNDEKNNIYSLPLLSMTIKAVYESNSPEFQDVVASANFNDSVKERVIQKEYEPYFFIASQNEARYANMINWENSIGSNFLGKYFIRWYENYTSHSKPSIQGCQNDKIEFYKQGSDSLDFSAFVPEMASFTSEIEATTYKTPSNLSSLPIYKFNSKQGSVKDSFILVERSPIWSPPLASKDVIGKVVSLALPHRPIKLGVASSFGSFVNNHPSSQDKKFGDNDFLWIGFKMPSGLNISVSSANHPTESARGKACDVYISEYDTPVDLGLKSTRCSRINIGRVASMYMPPQCKVDDSTDGGYAVYLTRQRDVDYQQSVPKIEFVVSNYADAPVLSNEINHVTNINLDNVQITTFNQSTNNCLPNHNDIKARMQLLSSNMKSITSTPSKTITYEIAGLPTNSFSISNGLIDLSVRVNSKGATSTLVFSDLKDRTVKRSEALDEFEKIPSREISNSSKTVTIHRNLLSKDISLNTYN